MDRRSPIKLGFALAFVLVAQNALAGEGTCRTGCRGSGQTFKYQVGKTYQYNYDSKIDITLSTAEGQHTSTEVKAQVLLTQQGDCNQILRLQNVQVIGGNGKKYGQIADIEKPIRLNVHDGHIEDSICVVPGDTQNSLNIKRAIASLFQVNLNDNHETDVFGLCPTETTSSNQGNTIIIQKSRNLNKCAYRENIKQDFLTTAFNLNSEIKSSPILNADYNAKLILKDGILDHANVVENYLYVPFSVGQNGAKAQVNTKIQYTGVSGDNPQAATSVPKSIIFENPHPVNTPKNSVGNIMNAVKETAKTIDLTVNGHTAKEFINLIRVLRVSNKDDLLAVYNQVKAGVGLGDKVAAKKIFLDALFRAANGDAVEVAIELLKNHELSPTEETLVYVGLSMVRHATESSLISAAGLLSLPNLPREAYLGIGNIAGRYCRDHSCENVDAVKKLTAKLISKLGDNKAANRAEENDMIFAIKAIANIHHLTDNVLSKLTAIAQDKKAPVRLRVAALDAFLADPCKDKLRTSALAILNDIQQDSEIRIKAYLALAQCPNAKVGNAVKALLEKEPSYQVGGFIVSHIRNIRASANPDKELAKQHLGFSTPKKFPVDFRKWSSNLEFSYSVDTLGVANSVESNIIYSQNSFLPRSTSLNLTAEVFGHTFNFLEVETRQENLDKLMEHWIGPKGILNVESWSDLYNNYEKPLESAAQKLEQKITNTLRGKRDLSKAELDSISKQIQIKTNELNTNLDLDLSLKLFGSELLFLNINDDAAKLTPDQLVNKLMDQYDKGIKQLKDFDETLRSNILFLDAEFAYPTSLGFPLRLGVEGSSNIQMKAKGKFDINNQPRPNGLFKMSLIPSANIEVAGRLTLDALVVETGLKVISNLYTATGGDFTAEFNNYGFDVKYALPVEEQKLISVSHEIVFHTRELGAREENKPLKFAQNKDFSICLDQLSSLIGLTFCGEINGPNLSGEHVPVLPFPLAGDAKVEVSVTKDDVMEYHLKHHLTEEPYKFGVETLFETIGKNKNQKVALTFDLFLAPEKFVKLALVSPIKKAAVEGRITDSSSEKSVSVRLTNDASEFFGKLGVSVSGSGPRVVYKPLIEYRTPQGVQQLPYKVEGQIILEQNGENTKYILDNVKLVIPNQKPLSIKGNVGKEGSAVYSDLTLSDGTNSGSLKGRLLVSGTLVKFNAEAQNSLNPEANVNVKGEFKKLPDGLETHLQVIHGADLSSKKNILTLANSFTRKFENSKSYLIATKNKLTYPLFGVNVKFEFENSPKNLDYDVNLQYNDVKLGSELDLKYDQKEAGDYQVEFEIWGLDNNVELKASRSIEGEESKIDNSLVVNGKKLEVKGKVKHHIKPQNLDVGSDLTVKIPTNNVPYKVNNGLKLSTEEVDAFYKITNGADVLIDTFLKASKIGNANGSIKVNVKNLLVINGQVKAIKGSGSGDILIDVQSIKRQVKADTTFTLQPPSVFNVVLNLYPVYEEDKNKKLSFSTHNKLGENSIESKNVFDALGNKLELNLKGSKQETENNFKGNGEVEVTLPNGYYIVGKLNREKAVSNDVINGKFLASLETRNNKNTPGRKINLKGQAKNTNIKEHIYDLEYNLAADDGQGKTLNGDLTLKHDNQGQYAYKSKVHGSVLQHPIESSFVGHCKKGVEGQMEASVTYGPKSHIIWKGKYDVKSQGQPISVETQLDVATPSKILKVLKAQGSFSILVPKTEKDSLELQLMTGVFADDDGAVPEPIINLKTDLQIKGSKKDGVVQAGVEYGNNQRIVTTLKYGIKDGKDTQEVTGNAQLVYGNKKVTGDITLVRKPHHEYKLIAQLDTPTETHKSNKLVVQTKRSDDGKHITSKLELSSDGKTWTADTDYVISDLTPSMSIKVKSPEGKLRQISLKANKISDKHVSGEVKLVNQEKNFAFEASVDAKVENADDFAIRANIHSPALKLEKITAEAINSPNQGGRKIQINVKSGAKNILSGSSTYTAREEHGKLIVEGSGSFAVKEETKSANFKFIRQQMTQEKNGETGIEVSLDASLGNRAIDSELKVTNKQFRILNSYCEEKKECAHVEIDAKTNVNDVHQFNQELEIAIDLRKLGLSHEFGLKAVTNRKEFVLDHTVDVHFQSQENSKYQYSVYLHPKEAGVSLTTPKRQIALEAKVDYPREVSDSIKTSGELVFYLDKKHNPNKKTSISGSGVVDIKNTKLNGHVVFQHPGLQRPLSLSVNGDIDKKSEEHIVTSASAEVDIFAQPNQKLVLSYLNDVSVAKQKKVHTKESLTIKSAGLGIDIQAHEEFAADRQAFTSKFSQSVSYHIGNSKLDNVFSWDTSKTQSNLLVKVLNKEILKVSQKYKITQKEQVVDTEVSSLSNSPVVSHLEIKDYNSVSLNVYNKGEPNKKIHFSSALIPGQIADVRTDVVNGGDKKNLFHATVKLDEASFLKSDYNVDSKSIENVLGDVKQRSSNYLNGVSELGKEWTNDLKKEGEQIGEITKRATPNLKPLREYYATELKKIREEIVTEKTLKDLAEFLKSIFGTAAQVLGDLFSTISESVERVAHSIQTSFAKVLETIDKELLPQLKKLFENVLVLVDSTANAFIDVTLGLLAKMSKIIEQYQPELKQVAAALGEISQESGRFVVRAYDSIKQIVSKQWERLSNELKALPVFEELKQQYNHLIKEGLPNVDFLVNGLKEAASTVKDVIPPEMKELKEVVNLIEHYLEQKLRNQPVNDIAEIEKILSTAVKAFQKVVNMILSEQSLGKWKYNEVAPLSFDFLSKLPNLVAIKFSPLAHVLSEETTGLIDFMLSLWSKPRNWVPPFPLFGLIVQGQHIFTFDGKHLTFPGKCNYLLARDALNGNFTLVGTYNNGLLNAITLASGANSVTIKKGGSVLLNNAATEVPVRKPEVAAYRTYETIHLRSNAGVLVICTPDLMGCSIEISGFYHGQLRGLLGNGNNEPYDDFTLPNGKIVSAESEFGNAYKTQASCAAVKTVDHSAHGTPNPACTKLFSWESSLRLCYPFISTDNFKMACEHGLAAGVKDTEVAIAKAYVAACTQRNIPVRVPSQFVKCTNSDKPFSVGDTFSVKTPGKVADIVLLVDTYKTNEPVYKELVQPLVQEVSKELHSKGFSDVEFHLIAYGGENQWPSHVTVGGKLTFKGKAPNLKFTEEPKDHERIGEKHIDEILANVELIIDEIKLALGLSLDAKVYAEGTDFPFRANAAKAIIGVRSQPCEAGRLLPLQKMSAFFYRNPLLNLNLITPFKDLDAKDAKQTKDIVGWNSEGVFTLSQAKKKPEGSPELLKDLQYNDHCADFSVKNHGNVFVSDNFVNAKGPQRKQFVQVVSHNIVNQLTNREQGLDCECKYVNSYTARNICSEVTSKEKQRKPVARG